MPEVGDPAPDHEPIEVGDPAPDHEPIEVGDPAPDLQLIGADGQPWRLRDRRGRPVVLIFHRHIH